MSVEDLGTRQLHTLGAGSIAMRDDVPHAPYEMPELGATVEVELGTPEVLGTRVGQSIEATSVLWAEPPGEEVGFVLHFHDGDVGIANVADDLMVLAWHDPRWSEWGITRLP